MNPEDITRLVAKSPSDLIDLGEQLSPLDQPPQGAGHFEASPGHTAAWPLHFRESSAGASPSAQRN